MDQSDKPSEPTTVVRPAVHATPRPERAGRIERGDGAERVAPDWRVWLALCTLYVVWGSTYLAIRVAVETLPPFLMAAVQFVLAGSALITWCVVRNGRDLRWPTRRELFDTGLVGAFLLLGGNGLVAWGEQSVASGIAALLVATTPVWVALLGWLVVRERVAPIVILGIVVGLVGVVILAAPGSDGELAFDPVGLLALLVAPLSWAIGSIYATRHHARLWPALLGTGIEMLVGGVCLGIAAVGTGELSNVHPEAFSQSSLLAVGYLILVGSLVGYTAYSWLLRAAPLPLVATYAYVNPVVAVALGALILSEPIEPRTLIAGVVIVLGVALIITGRGRMQQARPSEPAGTGVGASPGSREAA